MRCTQPKGRLCPTPLSAPGRSTAIAELLETSLELRLDSELGSSRIATQPVRLHPGEVLLEVDEFALTANNFTYARLGESVGYWRFFPTRDPAWGRIPAWGYATVIASDLPEIAAGRQVYGFVPMASHLALVPARKRGDWFLDAASHRASLPPAYNAYRFVDRDTDPTVHELRPLLAPVFMLSFLLDDALAEHGLYGATRALVTSASSKAAIGTAFLLRERGVATTGITGADRLDFVASLGIYDEVLDYGSVDQLATIPTTLVDIAGDGVHRRQLAARLGDSLLHSIVAGFTRATGAPPALAEPHGRELFSAPERIVERTRQWGRHSFDERVEQSLQRFSAWAHSWIELVHIDDPEDVEHVFHRVRRGEVDPAQGMLLSLLGHTHVAIPQA